MAIRPAVRSARPADAPAIEAVARESWNAVYDGILADCTIESRLDDWYDSDKLTRSIRDVEGRRDAHFLVAEADDGSIHGFCQVGRTDTTSDRSVASLSRIYVVPSRWGSGLGTALLASSGDRLGDVDRIRVVVLADNDVGVSFYESKGFERVETHQSDLGTDRDEHVYEWSLRS